MTTFLGIYVTIGLVFGLLFTTLDNLFRKYLSIKYKDFAFWTAFIAWVLIWPIQIIAAVVLWISMKNNKLEFDADDYYEELK